MGIAKVTAQELVDRFQDAFAHGQDPDAEVQMWDADEDDWLPVTVLSLWTNVIRLYTDEP